MQHNVAQISASSMMLDAFKLELPGAGRRGDVEGVLRPLQAWFRRVGYSTGVG